jgi:16S rRNA processing protein RimM
MCPVRCVAVGRVGRPHGVDGEVRIDPMGGLPDGFRGYTRFYLGRGKEIRPVALESHRSHGRFLIAKIEGCGTPEAARGFAGAVLYVDRAEMPPLEEGEYYYADLIGCRLVDEAGRALGRVTDVFWSGAHDVLSVESEGRGWMIPVVSEWVLSLDPEEGVIVARTPEGLIT